MKALTEQQRRYAEARMDGLGIRDAAIFAGCPEKTASQAGSRLEKHPNVVAHLARLKHVESETVPGSGHDAAPPGVDPAADDFEDPKEFLKHAMNDRRADLKTRMQAAIALLPFEHQKMGETGKKQQRDNEAGDVVKGRFAPAKPPPSPQLKLVN